MRAIVTLFLGLALAAPATAQAEQAAALAPAATIPAATVVPVERAEVQGQVPLSGTLVARQEVQVFPQVSGYEITEILVEAGDTVDAGDPLARLSDVTLKALLAQSEAEWQRASAGVSQAKSQIASAEAARTQAVSALDRARRLQRSGNIPQAALDQAVAAAAAAQAQAAAAGDGLAVAEAALAQADAARSIARLNVERATITAPVAGLIVTRNAERGAIAAAGGQPLFTIIADGEIELSAQVIETALRDLTVDQPAQVEVAGIGTVTGKVRLIPASVDPVTRLGVVRISLDDDARLRTGVFASGVIITARREALTVPATAVLADATGERVQVVRDGRVETRAVRAGLLWQGRREIVEGLAEGDQVIARSGAFFRDGDQVIATAPAAPASAPEPAAPDAAPPPAPTPEG